MTSTQARTGSAVAYVPIQLTDYPPEMIAAMHEAIRTRQIRLGEIVSDDPAQGRADLLDLDGFYLAPGGAFVVAHRPAEDKIAGFVGLRRTGPHSAQLKRLAVVPDERGHGVGTGLVQAVLACTRQRGVRTVELQTGQRERARPIYLRAGFVDVGTAANGDHLMRRETP